jgi:hypothetical protein
MTTELLDSITINYVNGNRGKVRELLIKQSKNKQNAMENVLDVYEHLRVNFGQNTATNFSVYIRT